MRRYHRNIFKKYIEKKKDLEITPLDEIQISSIEAPQNSFQAIDEIEIIGKDFAQNIKEPIDEIQIIGKQRIPGIIDPIDEIEIVGKERVENIYEPIDEIEIIGKEEKNKEKNENENNFICVPSSEITISQKTKLNKKDKALMTLIDNNDSSIEDKDRSDKENMDDNIDLNMNEMENKKIKEINKLKAQLEKEKGKIKELVKKIIELESEMNDDKNKI